MPGTYIEQAQIDSAMGLSDTNTLTLRPDTAFTGKVIWKSSGTPLKLCYCSDVIIDNLEIQTTPYTGVVNIIWSFTVENIKRT
ncbi:MAG: hypothetical protein QNL42_05550 [Flavobacteriaceae bacterium]